MHPTVEVSRYLGINMVLTMENVRSGGIGIWKSSNSPVFAVVAKAETFTAAEQSFSAAVSIGYRVVFSSCVEHIGDGYKSSQDHYGKRCC